MKSIRYRMGIESGRHSNINHGYLLVVLAVLMAMPSVVFSWSSDTSVNTPITVAAYDQGGAVMVDDGEGVRSSPGLIIAMAI